MYFDDFGRKRKNNDYVLRQLREKMTIIEIKKK